MTIRPLAIVRIARAHAGASLIPEARWGELLRIAEPLPACASAVGFECRLTGGNAVDLGLGVSPAHGGAAVLAGRGGDHALARAVAADARWRRLRDFAGRWIDPGSRLAMRVPFLFLELDAGGPADAFPVPSVFLGLDWLTEELSAVGRARALRGLDDVLAAVTSLRRASLAPATRRAAHACFARLPRGGVLLHAGVMLARPGESLRLSVIVPRAACASYLGAIGRGDQRQAVAATLERYADVGGFAHPGSRVQLDFDAGGGDARLGVTLRPDDYRLWPALLRRLVDDGWCEAARASELLRWSGASVEQLDAAAPPCRLVRRVEHVKLVCENGRLRGAKAYFGVTPLRPPAGDPPGAAGAEP